MRIFIDTNFSLSLFTSHEADLKMPSLRKRLREISAHYPLADHSRVKGPVVINSNVGKFPFSSYSTKSDTILKSNQELADVTTPHGIVTSKCGRIRVALLGLLSDEPGIFRDGTFRGLEIQNTTDSLEACYHELVKPGTPDRKAKALADWILPLTHQTIHRDEDIARRLLDLQQGTSLVLGGHEHTRMEVQVTHNESSAHATILKSGSDVEGVNVIDLTFNEQVDPPRIEEMKTQWIRMADYEPSSFVQRIIDSHMSLLTAMENEDVLHAAPWLARGLPLSSKGTRIKQTTVGGIFCSCIKEEMDVDAAVINGASIKGDKQYDMPNMTYAELKAELPFPTKMVVVKMTRRELLDSIHYSRTHETQDDGNGIVERKGFLQVDVEFERNGFYEGFPDDELTVAVPRNLLKGFCKIEPLMNVGNRLEEDGTFPKEDDFVPAIDLVVRHCSKERWYEMFHRYSFKDLDVGDKGFLTRDDVKRIVGQAIGREPSSFVVDDMMSVLDEDENGVIDAGEFSHLISYVEREHFNLLSKCSFLNSKTRIKHGS